ncbi:hypothetical protein F0U59_09350 [Archangium gephyra]|nr:hypothetical protein F0U59_09350 [Archangium gephyra]
MKKAQVKTLSTERLVEEFGILSASHGRDIEGAKPKVANRKFDVLVEIQRELRIRGVEAQRQLLRLLDDTEPGTRYWVSSFALEFAPSGRAGACRTRKNPQKSGGFYRRVDIEGVEGRYLQERLNPWLYLFEGACLAGG